METVLLTLGTAAMLGALHAFEVDHMLAVTTFVSRRPSLAVAARFGARWGIGHSIAVLVLGGVVLAAGLEWPARYDAVGEAVVGVMLVGLGVWALAAGRRLHLHDAAEHGDHAHVHLHLGGGAAHEHPHPHPHDHHHGHDHGGITLVGLMHGLAGTGGVVALLPVTLLHDRALGIGYLVAFGVGVTAGMMVFALVAAAAMRQAARRSLLWGRRITTAVGAAGVAVGCWWVWRAVGG